MNELKVQTKEEFKLLLDNSSILSEVETIESIFPLVRTDDRDTRREIADMMEDEVMNDQALLKFDLLLEILQYSNTIEDLMSNVEKSYRGVKNQMEKNLAIVYEKTKPFEKTARGLSLIYQNSRANPEVYILQVDAAKFADSAMPKDFEKMESWLQKQFYKFFMDDSPFYISYVGDIGSSSALNKIASVAHETKALAVVDIRSFSKATKAIDFAKRNKFKGSNEERAHVVIPGSWIYASGAKTISFEEDDQGNIQRFEEKMAIPASGALLGKLMSVKPGVSISGIESSQIIGMDGVFTEYDLQRIDAAAMGDVGLLQIIDEGYIQGSTTLNDSSNRDLNKFAKVDVTNALLKDLIQFCNKKAFGNWGKEQELGFKNELENYFNRRIRQNLIESYTIKKVQYDTVTEAVIVELLISFFEIVDAFDISIKGKELEIKK